MSVEKGVANILVENDERKILLGRRKGSYRPGEYGPPGGKLEPDEEPKAAARRELIEEAGIDPEELEYIGIVIEGSVDGASYTKFGFLCRRYKGVPENMESDQCEGWEWFLPSELAENTIPEARAIIEMYLNPDSERVRDLR